MKSSTKLYIAGSALLSLSFVGAHYVIGDGHGGPATFLSLWWAITSFVSFVGAFSLFIGAVAVDM